MSPRAQACRPLSIAAQPGDVITLASRRGISAGRFDGRGKHGDGWVVIRPTGTDLPPSGQRDPARTHQRGCPGWSARLARSSRRIPGAHHLRLVGLEIAPAPGIFLRSLVDLGGDADQVSALPHDIIIDRCYLRGDPQRGARRGVALNSRHTAIVDSLFLTSRRWARIRRPLPAGMGPAPSGSPTTISKPPART